MIRAYLEKRRAGLAQQQADQERKSTAIEKGRKTGEAVADAVDDLLARLVQPWSEDILRAFTKKVSMKVIFSDDDPAPIAREELGRFQEVFATQLIHIEKDVREKLDEWEGVSREWNMLETYEMLLKSRFDGIRLHLTTEAMNNAADVVMARREEMGISQEEIAPLANGRRILSEVRAIRIG